MAIDELDLSFDAWSAAADRVEAFAAALSALAYPGQRWPFHLSTRGSPGQRGGYPLPVDEILAAARAGFTSRSEMDVDFGVELGSGRGANVHLWCRGEEIVGREPPSPLSGYATIRTTRRLETVIGDGARSTGAEAAVVAIRAQEDLEDLLLRLCMPDAQTRVTSGNCADMELGLAPPVERSACYHADAAAVARDLAVSWVHMHDGDFVATAGMLSSEALAARVDAAPRGAHVGVANDVGHVSEHLRRDREAAETRGERAMRPEAIRSVPRATLPGDLDVTREQILAALATPPDQVLAALEAAAVPDDEWRAAEPLALAALDATKQGAPTYEIDVSTGRHVRWIELHAPYRVRRLPNGGVMLATHPYRILWPLWADALQLLGLR